MRISDWSSDVCSSDLPACLLQSAIFHALIANQPDDTETNTDRSHCNAENVDLEGYDIQTVPNRLACRYRLYVRSEEHTSELQSLMRISYAVFCLKKKKKTHETHFIASNTTHTP